MTAAPHSPDRPFADVLIEFIAGLRNAGVPISIAEALDATRAITITGLARARLREALRASLIKDEAHSPLFERAFSNFFAPPSRSNGEPRQRPGGFQGVHGIRGKSDSASPASPLSAPRSESLSSAKPSAAHPDSVREEPAQSSTQKTATQASSGKEGRHASLEPAPDKAAAASRSGGPALAAAASGASLSAIERIPFVNYSPLEYQQARDALVPLLRQLRTRFGRRMRSARAGRIDLRRTLHAAIQRGGAPVDLRFRSRRPKHLELVVLADISGSVQYASNLLLELVAGLREHFRHVRSFVFIDELAEAGFENGHLVMTPTLDLFARSDFGRVLAQLNDRCLDLFNRATAIVIMGDGRNNRRPARADLLRRIGGRCRFMLWLNPEPVNRWDTGDSAIAAYKTAVNCVLPCGDLRALAKSLDSPLFRPSS